MQILVTGGTGMVGKHLQEILPNAIYVGSKDYDLRDWLEVENLFQTHNPTHVIHLAAKVGGIQDNMAKPAEYFDDNILINTNVLKASHIYGVDKFIGRHITSLLFKFFKINSNSLTLWATQILTDIIF